MLRTLFGLCLVQLSAHSDALSVATLKTDDAADPATLPPGLEQTHGIESVSVTKLPGQLLHQFKNDAVEWDVITNTARAESWAPQGRVPPAESREKFGPVRMEVRRVPVPGHAQLTMRGVFLKSGQLEQGQLIGCYSGTFVDEDARAAKAERAPDIETYLYSYNETHYIDPTSGTGHIHDTTPPFRQEVALINEPYRGRLPNVVVLDADMCRDRWGGSGLPYYANTQIVAGDELFVCYGATYEREYDTICSDSSFEDYFGSETQTMVNSDALDVDLGVGSQLTASPEAELGEAETNALQKPWHLGNLDAESYAAAFYFSTADDAGADAGASKWSAAGCLLVMYTSPDCMKDFCAKVMNGFLRAAALLSAEGACRSALAEYDEPTDALRKVIDEVEVAKSGELINSLPCFRVYNRGVYRTSDEEQGVVVYSNASIYALGKIALDTDYSSVNFEGAVEERRAEAKPGPEARALKALIDADSANHTQTVADAAKLAAAGEAAAEAMAKGKGEEALLLGKPGGDLDDEGGWAKGLMSDEQQADAVLPADEEGEESEGFSLSAAESENVNALLGTAGLGSFAEQFARDGVDLSVLALLTNGEIEKSTAMKMLSISEEEHAKLTAAVAASAVSAKAEKKGEL